ATCGPTGRFAGCGCASSRSRRGPRGPRSRPWRSCSASSATPRSSRSSTSSSSGGNVAATSTASVLLRYLHVMAGPCKYAFWMAATVALWGTSAQADAPAPPAAQPAAPQALSDAAAAALARGEAIEIFDERPDKPFDRDTELRLTGEQLAARGAVDLATALALLPDVTVRDAGRGGFNIDIRGARKGAVGVLIDGVLVSDP